MFFVVLGIEYEVPLPAGYARSSDLSLPKRTPSTLEYSVFLGSTLIAVRLAQLAKESLPISMTLLGILTLVRPLQP